MHTRLRPKITATRRAKLKRGGTGDGRFNAGTIIQSVRRPEHSSRKIHSADRRRTVLFEVIDHGTPARLSVQRSGRSEAGDTKPP